MSPNNEDRNKLFPGDLNVSQQHRKLLGLNLIPKKIKNNYGLYNIIQN